MLSIRDCKFFNSSCRESLGHKDLLDTPDQMDPLYAMCNYNIQPILLT